MEEARHHGCSRARAAAQSVCFKKGCAAYDCVLLDVSLEPAQQRLQGLVRRGDGGCVLPALRGADAQRAAERRQQLRVLLSVDLLRREQRANLSRTRLLRRL